jgi:hypothetical protein
MVNFKEIIEKKKAKSDFDTKRVEVKKMILEAGFEECNSKDRYCLMKNEKEELIVCKIKSDYIYLRGYMITATGIIREKEWTIFLWNTLNYMEIEIEDFVQYIIEENHSW